MTYHKNLNIKHDCEIIKSLTLTYRCRNKEHINRWHVKVSHSLTGIGAMGLKAHSILGTTDERLGGHPFPFAALSLPALKQVPIYCWVDRKCFPVIGWESQGLISLPSSDFLHHTQITLTTRLWSISKDN